jgi:hypothetical protein
VPQKLRRYPLLPICIYPPRGIAFRAIVKLGIVLPKQDTSIRADMDRNITQTQFADYAQCIIIRPGNRAIRELQVQNMEYCIECSIADPIERLDVV